MRFKLAGCMILFLLILISVTANVDAAQLISWSASTSEGIKNYQTIMPNTEKLIIENPSVADISMLENQNCRIRHKLKGATSFDCPKGISQTTITKVNAIQDEAYHIMGTVADSQIYANQVWAKGYDGSGVTVIVLDTGVDRNHRELRGDIVGEWDYVNNDPIAEDNNGHGTEVVGMITGNGLNSGSNKAKGVAPAAKIYMLKVCNGKGSCRTGDILAAMEYAKKLNGQIVSISLGSSATYPGSCDNNLLAKKVNELAATGKEVVVAAGNSGGLGVSSPGCASGAITVGAVNQKNYVNWWSGRGYSVDLLAPGSSIYSCTNRGRYAAMSGTSASTPLVSGAIALLLDAKPSATPSQIKNALYSSAVRPEYCYYCTRINTKTGNCDGRVYLKRCSSSEKTNGIVNVENALTKLGIGSNDNDRDKDGVPDKNDLCPYEYGKDCNGCKNECTGCARIVCRAGQKPYCTSGSCSSVKCPSDGCGKGKCSSTQYANYPSYVYNFCRISGNHGTCSANTCQPTCSYSSMCKSSVPEQPPVENNMCWSGSNHYLVKSSSQMKKFCKCITGAYRYYGYRATWGVKTAGRYSNYRINNYFTTSTTISYKPVYKVMCSNRRWYYTNINYYN